MNKTNNSKLTANAQYLRQHMTEEERKLWYTFLRKLPVTVHRQKVIKKYIVDFYIADAKLVIELDGAQHYEVEKQKEDEERDLYLTKEGYTILRYTNLEIKRQYKAVCEDIWRHIEKNLSTSSVIV